jgi:hypothetical protein
MTAFPLALRFSMQPAAAAVKAPDELAALGLDCGPRRLARSSDQGQGEL